MNLTEKYVMTDNCQRLGEIMSRLGEEKDNAVMDGIMSAAKQLCMSYEWFQTEMDAHKQAYEQARTRSLELKNQLDNMVKLVEGYAGETTSPDDADAEQNPEPCNIQIPTGPTLVFYCFGPFRVFQDDRLINNWNGHKGQLILKYLMTYAGKPVPKEKLMEALWPEADPEATRRNLHQAIYSLRHTLKMKNHILQYILFENECYLLNPEVEVWIDFVEFEQHVRMGRSLETKGDIVAAMNKYSIAEELFQGGFMEDEPYEEWAELKRNQLQNLYLDITDKLSSYYFKERQYRSAISQCQRILELDNCHEPAYQILMQCYLNQGQRHMAVRQYQTCMQALKETLGLSPSEKTQLIYRQLISP